MDKDEILPDGTFLSIDIGCYRIYSRFALAYTSRISFHIFIVTKAALIGTTGTSVSPARVIFPAKDGHHVLLSIPWLLKSC